MLKKRISKLDKEINLRNEAFRALSPEKQRVLIAQDVLQQLKIGELVAVRRRWLEASSVDEDKFTSSQFRTSKCEGCAVGGMLLCALKRDEANSCRTVNNYVSLFSDAREVLDKYFSQEQLQLIEFYYENGNGDISRHSLEFGTDQYLTSWHCDQNNTRLRLIMENIIVNDGTFVPRIVPNRKDGMICTPGYKYPRNKVGHQIV